MEFLVWQNKPRCDYRFGSFKLTPNLGIPPILTASGMQLPASLVYLLNSWSRRSSTRWRSSTTRESTRHPTRHSSCALVQLGDDGVADLLQLFLLVLELFLLSSLKNKKGQKAAQYLLLSLHGYGLKANIAIWLMDFRRHTSLGTRTFLALSSDLRLPQITPGGYTALAATGPHLKLNEYRL